MAVETSLLSNAVYATGTDMSLQLVRGRVGSTQRRHSVVNPMHSFYPTKDDRWMAITGGQPASLAEALGHPELVDDPRFADIKTRRQYAAEIVDLLDSVFRERTLAEWRERFETHAAFGWAPVQRPEDVVADPQAEAAGAFVHVPLRRGGSYRGIAKPVSFLHANGEPDGLPKIEGPTIGQHTDEILRDLGYAPEQIAELYEQEVVG
jgi:crotonobetainyl-CoA:carnitine CoA-transferase CaiB-like acyl-CoA transferase